MQHREQPPLPATGEWKGWRVRLAKHTTQQPKPLLVVQVQHAADGSGQTVVVDGWGTLLEAGQPAQTCPAAAPSPVDVVEVEPSLLKELTERAVADPAQFRDPTAPVDPKRRADIAEYQLGRHPVQFEWQPTGSVGKPCSSSRSKPRRLLPVNAR
jgi:hypothetical protein